MKFGKFPPLQSLPRKEEGAETFPAPSARRADRVVRPYKSLPRDMRANKVSPLRGDAKHRLSAARLLYFFAQVVGSSRISIG